jgi:excinuclease ABC subunit B
MFERNDVIIVASVSCIYGLGDPEEYSKMVVSVRVGMSMERDFLLSELVRIQYERNDLDFHRSTFRVRGDVVEIVPASHENNAIRVEFFGDEIERIREVDLVTGEILSERQHVAIFPASHFVTSADKVDQAIINIQAELKERLDYFQKEGKLVEHQRLEQRTNYDIEMLKEMGFCTGVENYSRHLTGRQSGETPYTLLDFFPDDWLLVIDESHVSVSQVRGMYNGDRSRKNTLVDYGFRLPSALDNRPLQFAEFEEKINQVIYVSATPGDYELEHVNHEVVEQIIRPTGLLDPIIEIRPSENQIDDLIDEIRARIEVNERVLVTTLTIRMSEKLTDYFQDMGLKVAYLHAEVKTLERIVIIRDFRVGKYDVLVGINLLREGLDLPEVSLVAILDADKQGFLRSHRSLVQTSGRAARNVNGKVIMYADKITDAMQYAIDETNRRRLIQDAHNKKHGITPTSIQKGIRDVIKASEESDDAPREAKSIKQMTREEKLSLINEFETEMRSAAKMMDFERAASLRDAVFEIKAELK